MALYVKSPASPELKSRDLVKLVMGLIATMSALVLSLLIASANTSRDEQISQMKVLSANLILLDRPGALWTGCEGGPGRLARYCPENA